MLRTAFQSWKAVLILIFQKFASKALKTWSAACQNFCECLDNFNSPLTVSLARLKWKSESENAKELVKSRTMYDACLGLVVGMLFDI